MPMTTFAVPRLPDSIARQLLRNCVLMVLSRAAAILVLVISVPVVVACLGPDGYGVWESLMAIAASAVIFQMVISGTVMWRVSMCYGAADALETQRIVRIGVGAALAFTVMLLPPFWWSREAIVATLQIPARWNAECRWLVPLVVGIMLVGGVNQALLAVVTGYQRAGLGAVVHSLSLVVTHLTSIVALLWGAGLDALLLGYLVGTIAMFVIIYPLACSLCGRLSLLPLWPSRRELFVLAPFAGLLLLSNMTVIFRDQTDKLVLASLVSPTTTGHFGMAQRLSSVVMQVCMVIYTPFTAAIGGLFGRKDFSAIGDLYQRTAAWMGAFAGLMTVIVCVLRQPLFVMWLGHDRPEAYPYLALLLFGSTSAIIFAGTGVALAKGIGRPGLETVYTVVTLVLVVLTKPLAIAAFGPVGAVASSAGSWCIGATCFLFLLHAKVNLPRRVIWQTIGIFGVTALASCGGWWATWRFPFAVEERLSAAIVVLLIVPLLTAAYLGLLASLRLIDISSLGRAVPEPSVLSLSQSGAYENATTDVAA